MKYLRRARRDLPDARRIGTPSAALETRTGVSKTFQVAHNLCPHELEPYRELFPLSRASSSAAGKLKNFREENL